MIPENVAGADGGPLYGPIKPLAACWTATSSKYNVEVEEVFEHFPARNMPIACAAPVLAEVVENESSAVVLSIAYIAACNVPVVEDAPMAPKSSNRYHVPTDSVAVEVHIEVPLS